MSKEELAKADDFKHYRFKVLFFYVMLNTAFGYIMTYISRNGMTLYIGVVTYFIGGLLMCRLFFSFCHRLKMLCELRYLKNKGKEAYKAEPRHTKTIVEREASNVAITPKS